MCGIAGVLDVSRSINAEALAGVADRMRCAIGHRGPDDHGVWVDAHSGVAFGHARLSVIDLSAHGHQPMASASGRTVVCYNGELYNFPKLRAVLERDHGARFGGHSDTEVLVEMIDSVGVDAALDRANGMFAFAAWDAARRVLHLARDRMGEKPLYYGWVGSTLCFGSELKALRCVPGFDAAVDRAALASYFRYGYVPGPSTIFASVKKVPPGSIVSIDAANGRSTSRAYWSLADVARRGSGAAGAVDPREALDELHRVLGDAVEARMIADVPLGAFLSGGIDSSLVTALMAERSATPVRSFTIGFREAAYDESEAAAAVAARLGTNHTRLVVTPAEAQAVIPELPTIYDEPFADPSQIPTILVSRLAREHVTVVLSGDGGDELFGGYSRYDQAAAMWSALALVPLPARRLAARAATWPSIDAWDRGLARARRALPRRLRTLTGNGVHRAAELLQSPSPSALYRDLLSHWREPEQLVVGEGETPTAFDLPLVPEVVASQDEHMMLADALVYLPDDILVKLDRASMSVSLEARVPLLDPAVLELAWRTPMALKRREGEGKWLMKELLRRYVPSEVVDRPKQGFGVPIDDWLRGPLRDWAEDLLDPHGIADEGYLRAEPVRAMWHEHVSGARNRQYLLWDVLMFQAWLRSAA